MHFPWGSLLRGLAGHDEAVLAGAAALLAPGAALTALISITPRDGVPGPAPRPALDAAYARCGLALEELRPATPAEVDASDGLLGVARPRAPEADLRLGDLEDLPFADDAFAAVTSFNAVQYAADPVAALREARRVARPGAPVVVVTWAEPERCESRTVLAALGGLLPPPPPGAGGPFALSAPGRLEELVSAAGLRPARAAETPVPFVFADLDTAVRAMLSAGPARIAVDHAGEEAAAAAIRTALAGATEPGGAVRQENAFRYLIAEA